MDFKTKLDEIDERLRRIEAHLSLEALPRMPELLRRPGTVDPRPDAVVVAAMSEPAIAVSPRDFVGDPPDAPSELRLHNVLDTFGRRSPGGGGTKPAAKTSIDYERFFGVAVLGRIGIAAVLLAAGYFGQLGWREIGPWGRVAVVYGLAALFIAVGTVLRKKVSRLYLALLWGGGTAAMYLAGVLAKLRFGIVGPTQALVMLIAGCAVGQFLAYKVRFQALAITALVGAFAAPVLVGSPADARTVLMVYLLALHAWGAFTEKRFGWEGARLVGVAGTLVVGCLWLGAHGQMDVSTYAHIQGYIFGLTLPEWGAAVLGRAGNVTRARVLFGLAFVLEGAAFLPPGAFVAFGGWPGLVLTHTILSNVMPLVALAWAALAVAARAREAAPTHVTTALARVAIAMILPSVWMVFRGRGLTMDDVRTCALAALAAVAVLLVVVRNRFGLRDLGALTAAVLPIFTLNAIGHPDARILLAIVPAAALVGWGRDERTRSAGYVAGVCSILIGFSGATSPSILVAGFGAFAAWAVLARETRRLRDSDGLRQIVDVSFAAAVALWTVLALVDGAFFAVPSPLANPGTAAALLLAAAIVVRAPWRADKPRVLPSTLFAGAALVAIVGLTAWRELHAALATHATADAQLGVETFFFCGAALAALGLARRTGVRYFAALAIGLIVLAHHHTYDSIDLPGNPWWIVGEIAALAASAWALGATARVTKGEDGERLASAFGALAAIVPWFVADAAHRLGHAPLLANPRFVGGVVLAGMLVLVRFEAKRGLPRVLAVVVGIASALVAFEAGRLEVVGAVTALDSQPWRDALGSLYTAVFASGVLAVGFARRAADLRWLALSGFGILVLKVAFHDLANLSTPLRILITGCFGVILLLAAYAYARGRRVEASPASGQPPTGPTLPPG